MTNVCWVQIAGVWFTAERLQTTEVVSTVRTVLGQHVVDNAAIRMTPPCRWPV